MRAAEHSYRKWTVKWPYQDRAKLIEGAADSLNNKTDPFAQRVCFIKLCLLITTSAVYFTLIVYPENNHGLFFRLSLPGPDQNTLSDIDDASP